MENEQLLNEVVNRLCDKNGWDEPEDRELAKEQVGWLIDQLRDLGVII